MYQKKREKTCTRKTRDLVKRLQSSLYSFVENVLATFKKLSEIKNIEVM